jgi:predicted DNA-binding transcriptional regulator AlpA
MGAVQYENVARTSLAGILGSHRNAHIAVATMSIQSTGLSREEKNGSRALSQFDCVRTVKETAAILGIGEPSLRVMIREGKGPQVTRLSARRIGIRDSHREFWLAGRVEVASA